MTAGPGAGRPTTLELPRIEADPLFADAVGDAIAGDAAAMPGVLDRPVGRDPHDFSSLYVRHRSSFVGHARRYLNDQRDIDEVVQEALLRLFLALPELETELQALAYCRRTVTNLCIDRYRAQARRPRMVGYDEATDVDLWDDGNIDDPIYAAEDAAIVREALALLSPTHREALIKREVEEKSLSQIAAEMGIPETAVKHTLHRARRSLRRALATLWEESGQGVKSALVLIMAVLLALPFLSRGGNNGAATKSQQALGGQSTPAPTPVVVPTTNGDPQPTSPAAPRDATPLPEGGSDKWPTVPQLSLPSVPVPSVVVPPTQRPTPPPTPPTPPTPPPTSPPTPTLPTVNGGLAPLLTFSGTAYVASPQLPRQQLVAAGPAHGAFHASISEFAVLTTQGRFSLDQVVSRQDADGATALTFSASLPDGGDSVAAVSAQITTDTSTLQDGSLSIKARFLAHAAPDLVPAGQPLNTSLVIVDLVMSPDLASVVSEHVVLTPSDVVGGVGLLPQAPVVPEGTLPADPLSGGGSPTGGQSQAQLQQPAVEVTKQVIGAS